MLRTRRKWSQLKLAGKAEVTRETVVRWENGIDCPRMDKLHALAKAFGITMSELLKGVD